MICPADAVNNLKRKVIKDFEQFICNLKIGYKPNQEFILEEISLIDIIEKDLMCKDKSSKLLQFYLNGRQYNTFPAFL